jgi:hypothetical protein
MVAGEEGEAMITRLTMLVGTLALATMSPIAAKDKATADVEVVQCEGVFGRTSSAELVRQTYGAENVVDDVIYGSEGAEIPATIVYPDDPQRRMNFIWWDEEKREYLSSVELSPSQSTPEGVRIGMGIEEVEKINGTPFDITGFWWDFGGGTMIEEGRLVQPAEGCSFWFRLAPDDDYDQSINVDAIAGDVLLSSSDPLLAKVGVHVQSLQLGYPWPEELPEPEWE